MSGEPGRLRSRLRSKFRLSTNLAQEYFHREELVGEGRLSLSQEDLSKRNKVVGWREEGASLDPMQEALIMKAIGDELSQGDSEPSYICVKDEIAQKPTPEQMERMKAAMNTYMEILRPQQAERLSS